MNYTLRFDLGRINELALLYVNGNSNQKEENDIVETTGPTTRKNRFYSKSDFLRLCHWKSPRTKPHCEQNEGSFIREVTTIALKTNDERLRIEILTLLNGVAWPTASVLLHFGHNNPYPILDFRALWSLTMAQPKQYDFPFWDEYVKICKEIAMEANVSMRILDRALWQYSKDNQSN